MRMQVVKTQQFKDMIKRDVVLEIAQAEVSTYTGPINFIILHKVYNSISPSA